MEWTSGLVLELIKEYKKKRELWDTKHPLYRVNSAKHEAWQDMATLFACEVSDLRQKLRSLFASHRRERQKVRLGKPSNWFAYNHMKFLPTHLVVEPSVQEVANDVGHEEQEEAHDSGDDDYNTYEEEVAVKQEPNQTVYIRQQSPTPARFTMRRRLTRGYKRKHHPPPQQTSNNTTIDSKILDAVRTIRRSDIAKKRDECDLFGEYIANSLKKHDDRTRSMIKHAINNILFEQEMKVYGNSHVGNNIRYGNYQMIIDDENPLILTEQLDEGESIMPDLNETNSSKKKTKNDYN